MSPPLTPPCLPRRTWPCAARCARRPAGPCPAGLRPAGLCHAAEEAAAAAGAAHAPGGVTQAVASTCLHVHAALNCRRSHTNAPRNRSPPPPPQELGVNALHIKLRATGGNRTKTPGPGAQSALRALARSGIKIGRIGEGRGPLASPALGLPFHCL